MIQYHKPQYFDPEGLIWSTEICGGGGGSNVVAGWGMAFCGSFLATS